MLMKKILLTLCCFSIIACDKGTQQVEEEDILDFPEIVVPSGKVESIPRKDVSLTKAQEQLAAGTVDFSFRILQEAGKVFRETDNIALSPLSASLALSMLANGAAGETRQEIINALGFKGSDIKVINDYSELILTALPALDNTGVMSFANSLWLNSGYKSVGFDVADTFEDGIEGIYDAEIHEYDFVEGPGLINAWCSKKTNGLIKEILETLYPEQAAVLANALYFKGKWGNPFNEASTTSELFYNADGSTSTVDMMSRRGRIRYLSSESEPYSLIELPYGNEAFSFQILLPDADVDVDVDDCLSGSQWVESQQDMKYADIELHLPKFKVSMNQPIDPILNSLGIKKMYSPIEADFSNMTKEGFFVELVKQATDFSVDEEGTEAAAVTIISMPTSSGEKPKEPEYIPVYVNRPFVFLIREVSTNSILFIGKTTKL